MLDISLVDILSTSANAYPQRNAVFTLDKVLTYSELDSRSSSLANYLQQNGYGPNDPIAIHSRNSYQWIEIFFAILKIGAIPININYRYLEDELTYIYNDSQSICSFVSLDYQTALRDISKNLFNLSRIIPIDQSYENIASSKSDYIRPLQQDNLYIIYTGGTTGMPKGVVWKQSDLVYSAMNAYRGHRPIESLGHLTDEIKQSSTYPKFMAVGPLMHGTSQWMMGTCFLSAGTFSIYTENSFNPQKVCQLLDLSASDSLCIIGDAMAKPLIEYLQQNPQQFPNLSLITNAAAPLSYKNYSSLKEIFSNVILLDSYGSSELGSIGSSFHFSSSRPRFNLNENVNIFNEKNEVCSLGQLGKLARTGHIPLCYWNDYEKTSQTFFSYNNQRWVYSGDYAILEDNNQITLLGRGSICINSGGEKIYPEEVEHYIKLHPDVSDAIVCGIPDLRWGRAVCALVVSESPSLSSDNLMLFLRSKISSYKLPKHIYFVPFIQKTESSKPDYVWATHQFEFLKES